MRFCALVALSITAGCSTTEPTEVTTPPVDTGVIIPAALANKGCAGTVTTFPSFTTNPGAAPTSTATLKTLAAGNFRPTRRSGEVAVSGSYAYTTTWGNPSGLGAAIYVWNIAGTGPALVDSINVAFATTLGDAAVSDDGKLLIVASETTNGTVIIFDLADPKQPKLLSCFRNDETTAGVHTAEIGRVNGKLYGFLSIDPRGPTAARLVTLDLSKPATPVQVFSKTLGSPYVHDTFVRDGYLFLALWNDGVAIWDIGGGGKGGTPSNPVELGRVRTVGGEVHNVWWMKDPVTGLAKYAFIGQEGPGSIGVASAGDVHVVDISNPAAPREVAFYTVIAAGTHNFSVDEANGILYAAYYNAGVRALDVRGELGTCTDAQKSIPLKGTDPLCDLSKMGREVGVGLLDQGNNPVYIWGVQYVGGAVYASDMINGIWKLRPVTRP